MSLHFCWLVDEWTSSREKYLRAWMQVGWPVVLWHGGQLAVSPVEGVELRHAADIITGSPIEPALLYEKRHKNHAACADLFRYHVLYELGGAYSDIDILPGRNALPALCESAPHPVFGREWIPLAWHLEIRFIATPGPRLPLMKLLRDTAVANSEAFIAAGGHTANSNLNHVIGRTGPAMAKSVIQKYARDSNTRFSCFVLKQATLDNTKENAEHYTLKQRVVRDVATHP